MNDLKNLLHKHRVNKYEKQLKYSQNPEEYPYDKLDQYEKISKVALKEGTGLALETLTQDGLTGTNLIEDSQEWVGLASEYLLASKPAYKLRELYINRFTEQDFDRIKKNAERNLEALENKAYESFLKLNPDNRIEQSEFKARSLREMNKLQNKDNLRNSLKESEAEQVKREVIDKGAKINSARESSLEHDNKTNFLVDIQGSDDYSHIIEEVRNNNVPNSEDKSSFVIESIKDEFPEQEKEFSESSVDEEERNFDGSSISRENPELKKAQQFAEDGLGAKPVKRVVTDKLNNLNDMHDQIDYELEFEREPEIELELESEQEKEIELELESEQEKEIELELESEREKEIELELESEQEKEIELELDSEQENEVEQNYEKNSGIIGEAYYRDNESL